MEHTRNGSRRLGRIWLVVCIVVLLAAAFGPATPAVAAPVIAPAAQQNVPRFEPGPCTFETQSALVAGRDYQCGWLVVPEMYENPTGPTIRLGVAIVKSRDPNPAPDPLVMLQGGPGGSTIDTYLQFLSVDPRLRGLNRDIVLFDQRGTLYTRPSLVCTEYFDETIRQLNENLSKAESNKRAQDALKACHDRLVKQGVNLSAFNSLENADDIESLRTSLGYPKINLYGVSYGTLLALHYLRQYPQSLRSLTLDSVVPPQINFITDAVQSENRSLEKVFSACASDPQCSSAYPNLKQVLFQLVDKLNANKVHIQVNDPKNNNKVYPALLDGDTLLNVVTQMLYVTEFIPLIPRFIYQVRSGDYSFLEQVLSLLAFDRTLSYGMYFSVLCAEDADFTAQDINLNGLPPELKNAQQDTATEFLKTCSFWKVKDLSPAIDQPVSGSVPTLVLSGAFDPVTPPNYAQTAAKTLSNSYFFEFPTGGHGEVTSGECQDSIFTQFLQNPGQKPNGSCISQMKLDFVTPGEIIRLPVLIKLFSAQQGPLIQLGAYALALLFLLTALLVYPIVWLVRLFRRPPAPTAPVAQPGSAPYVARDLGGGGTSVYVGPPAAPPAAPTAPAQRPRGLYHLAPWLAALTGLDLLVFIAVITGIAFQLALANDTTIRLGLPGSTRPLFILPIVAALLALLMLIAALVAWSRRTGSALGRVYFTLLTIAALVCVAILALWGMLTAIIA